MSGAPPRVFKSLNYLGRLLTKKLSSTSQYTVLEDVPVDPLPHSQIGDEYGLAQIGNIEELLDRLQKYDRDDLPINKICATFAMNHFFDEIKSCQFVDFDSAFKVMPKDKAIGYGAKTIGVFARDDPLMREYLEDYVEASMYSPHHVIITASQKDEIRPTHKTPRLFMSFPPEHTFLAIIVLNDFLQQFINMRFCVTGKSSALGDSMQNGAAAKYKEKLSQFPFLYCTDTAAQDSSVSLEFLELFYSMLKMKYVLTEEEENMYDAVVLNTCYKTVNVNGHLYMVGRGLGSGDYLTSVINVCWRLYLILDNYSYSITNYFIDNVTIINGDDLIMSSKYGNLDLNSRHVLIEWKGRPISWEEADFCSLLFSPYIHHDPKKILAVYYKRLPKTMSMNPALQMYRLGGLLACLSTRDVYDFLLSKMIMLAKKYNLFREYMNVYISYDLLFHRYNSYVQGN